MGSIRALGVVTCLWSGCTDKCTGVETCHTMEDAISHYLNLELIGTLVCPPLISIDKNVRFLTELTLVRLTFIKTTTLNAVKSVQLQMVCCREHDKTTSFLQLKIDMHFFEKLYILAIL